MESAGLKEWAIVCEAMGRGEQSVILRKGGLAEGRAGFAFRHAEFFLFPTFFHEQIEKVRVKGAEIPKVPEGEIEIRFFAKLVAATHLTSWERAAALEPLHILQPAVVRERFDYDKAPGLHVALVRVFRVVPSWIFPDTPRYAGCRSWVTMPTRPEETRFEPVLTDPEHDERLERFHALIRST
ncbi:MAG TPA: DUF1802 family protein [Chthoniobacterales bacterium]|nr:DUF1802 family protein [Chthoniobacterales bacterium]